MSQPPVTNSRPTAITIGNFDGVHRGHAELLRVCRQIVGDPGRVIAMAFDPHPATTLAPGRAPPRLTSFGRRERLLKSLGADEVIRLEPTPSFLTLTPEQFVDLTIMPHRPAAIVEGDDFHFGRRRAGNNAVLARIGKTHGFEVRVVGAEQVDLSDQLLVRASSSITRWLLEQGRVGDAARVMGRPYVVDGLVVQGDQRGRAIGFPTANVASDQLLPADGVYAGTIRTPGGPPHGAAINVGRRPTFAGVDRRLEVFAMNPDGSAAPLDAGYGWPAEVTFEHWIRDDLKLDSLQTLVSQIERDVRASVRVLAEPTRV